MKTILLFFIFIVEISGNILVDYLKCKMCETKKMDGQISDCNCKFETVDDAVSNFFIPLLNNVTSRYFKVDLDKPCPFWEDDGGMCTNEGCSICPCEPDEVPKVLIIDDSKNEIFTHVEGLSDEHEYGWISRAGEDGKPGGKAHSGSLGKVSHDNEVNSIKTETSTQPLEYNWEWTEISEESHGIYINLVKNPEKFTGYSGMSARLVWKSIQEENCFGGGDTETCFEKRVFYKLMSGLQSSIATQIARDYYFAPLAGETHNGRWGPNIPMFIKAVGAHPSRVANLYFTFLFVTRAVAKAQEILLDLDYSAGDENESKLTKELIHQLVQLPNLNRFLILPDGSTNITLDHALRSAAQCSIGFDESGLFQSQSSTLTSNPHLSDHWGEAIHESHDLREEFRQRFRNISRIMDCVSCEKCRVWGKLEILGLGTAIKILLTPEKEMREIPAHHFLSRQEVVALINTLNQFAKSIHFASHAMEMEFGEKIEQIQTTVIQMAAVPITIIVVIFVAVYFIRNKLKRKVN